MSPSTFAYLDYMQGDAAIEPPVYASLLLSKAYQFEPVPDGVDPAYIKAGRATYGRNKYTICVTCNTCFGAGICHYRIRMVAREKRLERLCNKNGNSLSVLILTE